MHPSLHIHRLSLPRAHLLPALRHALESTSDLLPPDTELVIRHLHIRLRVRPRASPEAIGRAWATAILRAIRHLARSPSDAAITFTDRITLGSAALEHHLRGDPRPWWTTSARLPWTAPTVGDGVLLEWLDKAPERVPAEVTGLVERFGVPQVGALFSPSFARRAIGILSAARLARIAERPSGRPPVAPPSIPVPWRAPPELTALPADQRRWLGVCLAWAAAPWLGEGEILTEVDTLTVPQEAPTSAMTDPQVSDPASPVTNISHPGSPGQGPDVITSPGDTPRAHSPARTDADRRVPDLSVEPGSSMPARVHEGPPGSPLPTSPRTSDPSSPAEALPIDATPGSPVTLGGLLFLTRWLTLTPLWPSPHLPGRLSALAHALIGLVTAGLSSPARAQILRDHAGLLEVFCRGAEPVGDPSPWLDTLRSSLPADLPWRPACHAAVHPDLPLSTWEDADLPLVYLLVRPGRLVLTRTHADLYLSPDLVDLPLRLGGWDLDPGWVPELGRVIRFHYREA